MKTKWNLKLFYASPHDPQIEKDVKKAQKTCEHFAKKYKHKATYLKSEAGLVRAMQDYKQVLQQLAAAKPLIYFYYLSDLNTADSKITARLNTLMTAYTQMENEILFFSLKLQKVSKVQQRKFLNSEKLQPMKYMLEQIFEQGKYALGEEVEKVLNLKSLPAHLMWVQSNEKMVTKQEIVFKRKKLPISKALNDTHSLKDADRKSLHTAIYDRFEEIADMAEAEMNAVFTNKKINDELRGFKEPYSNTLVKDQMDEKVVRTLINTVSEHNAISHDFYNVKSKLLGKKVLGYQDRMADIGSIGKKLTFAESVAILRKKYATLDSRYTAFFDTMLKSGLIDVYPKKGKCGGAYCCSTHKTPIVVLLNHTDSLNGLFVLAHEMGHALHSHFSRKQPVWYEGYSYATAEVASTTFENLLYDDMLEKATPRQQKILLHDRLNGDMSSVFRQTAFFKYEEALHAALRTQGSLDKVAMAKLFIEHIQAYLGPRFTLEDRDGYGFVHIGHFRRFFYVYSYVYGQLIAKVLARRVREDKKYIKDVNHFMSAGGSKSPKDIFKDIGIDTTKKSFWEEGLRSIKADIKRLESLL